MIAANQNTIPPLADFRDQLREQLESQEFPSLQVGRSIRFLGGELQEPPHAPVYEVKSELKEIVENVSRHS